MHVPRNEIELVLNELSRVVKDEGIIFIGLYGGKDDEMYRENDFNPGPRFFSSWTFKTFRGILDKKFTHIESGRIEFDGYEFHWFILKNSGG